MRVGYGPDGNKLAGIGIESVPRSRKILDRFNVTNIDGQPHRILVHPFNQIQFLYHFAFLRHRLERIVAVSCHDNDPKSEQASPWAR